MRLLHITRDHAPFSKGGGVERYIHHLALQQVRQGHAVEIAAWTADVSAVTDYRVRVAHYRALLQRIRAADRVHLHGPRVPYVAVAGMMAILWRKPFLYTAHCFYQGRTVPQKARKFLWDHSVERLLLSRARAVIVLSEYWRDYLVGRFLPARRLAVLPNGIDVCGLIDAPHTPLMLSGAPAILSVSRLDPVKRIEDAIAALAEPGLEAAHLHIVGRGDYAVRLREAADYHHVQARVIFHGFKSDTEVAAMAQAAHVFILASAEEGMPTSVLEMLARKLPVVAANIPGNRTLAGILGWPHLYPLRDVATLAATALAASVTPVGEDVRTLLMQHFDWHIIADRMQVLYDLQHPQHTRALLFDCPADRLSAQEIIDRARDAFQGGATLTIEGLNVAKLIEARRNPSLMAALHAASIVHLDGAGAALAAWLLRLGFAPRRAGVDLMEDLLALANAQGAPVFLLGARADVVTQAADAIRKRYSTLVIAGIRDGYFSDAQAPDVAHAIAASGAKLLLIGISSPKKEQFLHRYGNACGAAVAMGVGGTFDILAGRIRRAPRLLQRCGMEWLFRLAQEPRRLAGRYIYTNILFAGLLCRTMLRSIFYTSAPGFSWAEFLPKLPTDAAHCRHEIYFLHQKPLLGGRLHGVAAALRDLLLLLRQPRRYALASQVRTVAAATLPGSSGMGAVLRACAALPQDSTAVVAHPRVGAAMHRPAAIGLRDSVSALRQAWPFIGKSRGTLSRVIVASCVWRAALWQASWRKFLLANPGVTTLLLHNDFDMMSSALLCVAPPTVRVICLQHGLPTDEFFPLRAPVQLVWGEAARAAYRAAPSHATILIDALGRSIPALQDGVAPAAIYLLSQTHTRVYGIDLVPHFSALAHALAAQLPPETFRILLHPNETPHRAYRGIDRRYFSLSPHVSLQEAAPCALVVGYASTALLDAAQAGHYVAAMDWPVKASHAAHHLCQPPVRCADAAALLAYLAALQTAEMREAHQHAQRKWLAELFSNTGEFARYVA